MLTHKETKDSFHFTKQSPQEVPRIVSQRNPKPRVWLKHTTPQMTGGFSDDTDMTTWSITAEPLLVWSNDKMETGGNTKPRGGADWHSEVANKHRTTKTWTLDRQWKVPEALKRRAVHLRSLWGCQLLLFWHFVEVRRRNKVLLLKQAWKWESVELDVAAVCLQSKGLDYNNKLFSVCWITL